MEIVRSFRGDVQELGNAERFIHALSAIPFIKEKLNVLYFRNRFIEEVEDVAIDLQSVRKASMSIYNSTRFKKILHIVLVVGNFLNQGTWRGQAYGFSIESLLKLKETQSIYTDSLSVKRERAPTLLHYVARRLEETSDADALDLFEDIISIELASRVCISSLLSSVTELEKEMLIVKKQMADLTENDKTSPSLGSIDSSETHFLDIMHAFMTSAEIRVARLVKDSKACESEIKSLSIFLGEDPDKREVPFEDLFRIIWDFQNQLKVNLIITLYYIY